MEILHQACQVLNLEHVRIRILQLTERDIGIQFCSLGIYCFYSSTTRYHNIEMPPKKAYESYDSESEMDEKKKKGSQGKRQKLDKDSDDYKHRRERNNVAVRKSRDASRKKAKDTVDRVKKLRDENDALEQKVTILNKELGVLRDLFLTHASATGDSSANSSAGVDLNNVKVEDDAQSVKAILSNRKSKSLASDHKYVLDDN